MQTEQSAIFRAKEFPGNSDGKAFCAALPSV